MGVSPLLLTPNQKPLWKLTLYSAMGLSWACAFIQVFCLHHWFPNLPRTHHCPLRNGNSEIPGPHPGSTESEFLGVRPRNGCFFLTHCQISKPLIHTMSNSCSVKFSKPASRNTVTHRSPADPVILFKKFTSVPKKGQQLCWEPTRVEGD